MNIFKLCLAAGILFLLPSRATAQITLDGSTSTTVDNNGNVSTIDGGNQSGANLFHSFERFSVPNGNEAFFNNAADIENIFSRVTGGNISNIDGLIRANNVNLFLINPAGVIFGDGARLDLGGAFYGGSADSILFPDDVEFSANDTAAPVLTINAPIGLNFRNEPTEVSVQNSNLNTTGGDFNLFGGNINFNNATINALGSNVNLGAVSSAGTVLLDENLNLDFSNLSLADISFYNSQFNVNGAGGGDITINARNLSLSDSSTLSAGINSDSSTPETQAGNIVINATENLTLNSGSILRNNLSQISSGNAGDILIAAKNLSLADSSRLSTISTGSGNTGSIDLNITENTALSGTAEIKSEISPGATGNGGNIQINSSSISLSDNSKLLADVRGLGDGGDIIITTNTLDLKEQSDFSTNLSGQGNAGSINIQAREYILLEGSTFQTRVLSGAAGSAGSIDIDTGSLVLSNNVSNPSQSSRILASTAGTGNAGNINIDSDSTVSLDNDSSIQTQVESGAVGDAGNILINTTNLSLTDGTKPQRSSLLANSVGEGNGGNITINASENINLDTYGLILTQGTAGTGDAGDINLTSDTLSLSTGSVIVSTTGDAENLDVPNAGAAGNINISSRITTLDTFSGVVASSISNAIGEVGNATLNSDRLTIKGGSGVSALTENASAGGTIEVNAANLDILTGGGIVTLTNGAGDAGDINLNIDEQITIDGANPLIPPEEFRSPLEVERQLETET
ncbi:MAG: filamentous hemagglutinin N-terminal domain-containing protein, partial [Pleurocapsa sp.]